MKKVLSIILCGLFLNLTFSPMVLADDMIQPATGEQTVTDSTAVTNTSQVPAQAQNSVNVSNQTQPQASTEDSTAVINQSQVNSTVNQIDREKTEHLSIRKNRSKKNRC